MDQDVSIFLIQKNLQTQRLVTVIQAANKTKSKLKKLLLSCDKQKSGFIATSAFFQMLDLHIIKISDIDQQHIKTQYERQGGFLNYKEVLQIIQVNQDVEDPLNSYWLTLKSNSSSFKNPRTGNDQRSQISSRSSNYSQISIDQNLREKAQQILNKDCFMRNNELNEKIPEENENLEGIILGDDFQIFNNRQKQSNNDKILGPERLDNLLSKYDKKKYQIAAKTDQRIVDLQKMRSEQVFNGLITPLQPLESSKREGKKLNMSPQKYNYNDFISHDHSNEKERQEGRYNMDFPDYKNTQIITIQKDAKLEGRNLEQVHKTKVSPEYLKKILNPEAISERRAQIIKRLHEEAIDFRSLNQFRDKLFDSPNQKDDKLPIQDYEQIKNLSLADKLQKIDELILEEIKNEDETISLVKFSELIDLYTYYPVRLKKDKNKSEDLYFVLNSNQRGIHSHLTQNSETVHKTPIKSQNLTFNRETLDKKLLNIMDIVGSKLMEKFNSLSAAFRFFDANLNQSISYHEFYNALDHLGIKISSDDSKKIFNYLDTDFNNAVSYNEFCELSEEKRRGIDPFRGLQQPNTISQLNIDSVNELTDVSNIKPKNIYLSNISVDDLEQLSRFQSLSSLKKQKFRLQKGQLPQQSTSFTKFMLNNTLSYGKRSDTQNEQINNVINQNYLKDYLEEKVSRNAYNDAISRSQRVKTIHNKSSVLRSKSVMKSMKMNELENQIEDMKMSKSIKNQISFVEIQRNHQKMKKELSLPPIKVAMNSSYNGQSKLSDKFNPVTRNEESNASYSSPLLRGVSDNSRILNRNQNDVLDLIHKMRLEMKEVKDNKSFAEKPTSMTKREKEEILSSYFNAKKHLNSSQIQQ